MQFLIAQFVIYYFEDEEIHRNEMNSEAECLWIANIADWNSGHECANQIEDLRFST